MLLNFVFFPIVASYVKCLHLLMITSLATTKKTYTNLSKTNRESNDKECNEAYKSVLSVVNRNA